MATETIVRLRDDLDGSAADSTVAFTWQGVQYEIDLSASNQAKMQEALAPFVEAARRVGGRRHSTSTPGRATGRVAHRPGAASSEFDLGDVRAWARGSGITVSDRGRVSRDVLEKYRAAQGEGARSEEAGESGESAAPVNSTPAAAKKTPGRKAAAKKTPGRKAAAKKTRAKKAIAKKTPAKKAPMAVAS